MVGTPWSPAIGLALPQAGMPSHWQGVWGGGQGSVTAGPALIPDLCSRDWALDSSFIHSLVQATLIEQDQGYEAGIYT